MLENKGPVSVHALGRSSEVIENKGSDYLGGGVERLASLWAAGRHGNSGSRKRRDSRC
jgi:hypothetical protein